jgi:hypothetical protein
MYSKEEATKLREQFWITFGRYMKPMPSANGLPINWVNYKTGVKHLFFRMDANQKQSIIAIAITHSDLSLRQLYFEQFESLKSLFAEAMGEEWHWELNTTNDFGAPLAQISKTLSGVSIYNQQDWPTLISFLKPRIIALDQFWEDVKPIFEAIN